MNLKLNIISLLQNIKYDMGKKGAVQYFFVFVSYLIV